LVSDSVKRRLVAIFAADMVSYSRLVQADEVGTIRRQKALRKELIDPMFARFGGRIVKTTGDGLLVEFASVIDAVQCAGEIQEEMSTRELHLPPEARIRYRVGINLGDIVIDDDDILGDGVNIASRIEGLADPGGICISASAYEQIRGKTEYDFQDAGEHLVKNIGEPIRVYRLLTGDELSAHAVKATGYESERHRKASIAVLPFENLSDDPRSIFSPTVLSRIL
jgi:adenylate cyclase